MAAVFDRSSGRGMGAGGQPRQWFEYAVGTDRENGVTYTNDTGQEILLDLQTTASPTTESLIVTIDDEIELRSGNIGKDQGHRQDKTVAVPAGSTYRVTGRGVARWNELRPSE